MRESRGEGNGRNRRLSSQKPKREPDERKGIARKTPQGSRKTEKGEHLWNGCGSEAGKDERKQTERLSTGNRKRSMGNQAERKVENLEAKAERYIVEATVRRKR